MCNLSVMSTAGGAEIQLPVSDLKGLRVSKAWYLLTSRDVPDIRYPAGYPVSFAGYPV